MQRIITVKINKIRRQIIAFLKMNGFINTNSNEYWYELERNKPKMIISISFFNSRNYTKKNDIRIYNLMDKGDPFGGIFIRLSMNKNTVNQIIKYL